MLQFEVIMSDIFNAWYYRLEAYPNCLIDLELVVILVDWVPIPVIQSIQDQWIQWGRMRPMSIIQFGDHLHPDNMGNWL